MLWIVSAGIVAVKESLSFSGFPLVSSISNAESIALRKFLSGKSVVLTSTSPSSAHANTPQSSTIPTVSYAKIHRHTASAKTTTTKRLNMTITSYKIFGIVVLSIAY